MNPAENYILTKPEPFRSILLELQILVEHHVPEAELLYKWHLPFYYLNGTMFCFLNLRKTFVELSFPKGILLHDPQNKLRAGENRKNLRSLRYSKVEEVHGELVIEFLEQMRSHV